MNCLKVFVLLLLTVQLIGQSQEIICVSNSSYSVDCYNCDAGYDKTWRHGMLFVDHGDTSYLKFPFQELTYSADTVSIVDYDNFQYYISKDSTSYNDIELLVEYIALCSQDGGSQQLSLSGDTLYLENGGYVLLSQYINTDDQILSLNGDTLFLENSGYVLLSSFLDDTDDQQIDFDTLTNIVTLENGGDPFNLSRFLDNTDEQQLTLDGDTLSLQYGGAPILLSKYYDNTDDQTISIVDDTLFIEDGGSVYLGGYLDDRDTQQLSLVLDSLFLTNSVGVDLSQYDNSQQIIDSSQSLRTSIEGIVVTANAQDLAIADSVLTISGGDGITMTKGADNEQVFRDVGNNTKTYVFLNDIPVLDEQQLSLNGTELSIEAGNTIDLKNMDLVGGVDTIYVDGTDLKFTIDGVEYIIALEDCSIYDDQTLTLNPTTNILSIENGNSVDLSPYVSPQNAIQPQFALNIGGDDLVFVNDSLYIYGGGDGVSLKKYNFKWELLDSIEILNERITAGDHWTRDENGELYYSGGKVGIGTPDPVAIFHVETGGEDDILFDNGGADIIDIKFREQNTARSGIRYDGTLTGDKNKLEVYNYFDGYPIAQFENSGEFWLPAYSQDTIATEAVSLLGIASNGKVVNMDLSADGEWLQNGADTIYYNGNVGIGNSMPNTRLSVKSSGTNSYVLEALESTSTNQLLWLYETGNGDAILSINDTNGGEKLQFNANGNSFLNGGNVAIGSTTNPEVLLQVGKQYVTSPLYGVARFEDNMPNTYSPTNTETLLVQLLNKSTNDNTYAGLGFYGTSPDYNARHIAFIQAQKTGTWNNTSTTWSGDLAFFTRSAGNQSEKMRITSDGKIGIGTSPSDFFHIKKDQDASTTLRVENLSNGASTRANLALKSANGALNLNANPSNFTSVSGWNNAGVIQTDSELTNGLKLYSSNGIDFQNTIGTDAMTITDGNVGIGTITPSSKLHVWNSNNLGTTAGDILSVGKYAGISPHNDYLHHTLVRKLSANTWESTSHRIQRIIDTDANKMGFIEFGGWASGSTTSITLGNAESELLRVNHDGSVDLTQYGIGSNVGTATYSLAVDASGNVIEEPLASASRTFTAVLKANYNLNSVYHATNVWAYPYLTSDEAFSLCAWDGVAYDSYTAFAPQWHSYRLKYSHDKYTNVPFDATCTMRPSVWVDGGNTNIQVGLYEILDWGLTATAGNETSVVGELISVNYGTQTTDTYSVKSESATFQVSAGYVGIKVRSSTGISGVRDVDYAVTLFCTEN